MLSELSFKLEVLHTQCVISVKDAPTHIESRDSDVCKFMDKYVSCALPAEDGERVLLV